MLTDRQKQMLFCIEALYNTGNPHAVSLRKLFLEEFDLEWMGERKLPVTKKSKITQE